MPESSITGDARIVSATGQFEIDGEAPPDGARPIGGGYHLVLPESTGKDGLGRPVGAVGKPSLVINFERMTEAAWNWWAGKTGEDLSTTISSVEFLNPYRPGGAGWSLWTGGAVLHRPTFGEISYGNYVNVEIRITEMEP